MPLQSSIPFRLGAGLVGDLAFDGPRRANTGIISGTAANLVMARAFTIDAADGKFKPGGTGVFGGLLCNTHGRASLGTTGGGGLAPTLAVQAESQQEFLTMGELWCQFSTAVNIGDKVYFVQADGTLGVGTAGAGQTQIVGATIQRISNAAAGIAVVCLTGPQ